TQVVQLCCNYRVTGGVGGETRRTLAALWTQGRQRPFSEGTDALPSSHGRDHFGQSLASKKQTEADEGAYQRLDNVGLRRDGHDGRLVDWAKCTMVRRSKAKNRK